MGSKYSNIRDTGLKFFGKSFIKAKRHFDIKLEVKCQISKKKERKTVQAAGTVE